MATTSPLPGLVRIPTSDLVTKSPGIRATLSRWFTRSVAAETADTAGRIALTTSAVAATFNLGHLFFGTGIFGIFPYQYARLVIYGASFLSGTIIAAGYLSETRTARFTAALTTTMIAAIAFADLLHIPDSLAYGMKIIYGVSLIGAVGVAVLRAIRRRLTHEARKE